MKQRRLIYLAITLAALVLILVSAVLLRQERGVPAPEHNDYPSFRFGFAADADIPALIGNTLSPEHLVEKIPTENGTPSTIVYDGEDLVPWLLNCETVDRVEHFGDSVYVSYHPTEPQTCDMVILHYQDGRIVDIVTSWNNSSYFIEANLVNGWISGG